MKKIFSFIVFLFVATITIGQPISTINIPIRGLEKADGEFYIPTTDSFGVQVYEKGIQINTTPVPFTPTATGNTTNLQEYVTDPLGNVFFIDYFGNSIQLNVSGSGGSDTDVSVFALNATRDSLILIEDDSRYAVALSDLSSDTNNFYHVLQDTIVQNNHGFTLNNTTTPFIPVRFNVSNGLFERASTSAAVDLPWTNIVEVIDGNTFICQPMGPLWNRSHTLTIGNFLFLQDDGSYNSTSPDADYNVVIASIYDNDNIWLYDNRPLANSGSGSLDIVNARNGIGMNGDTLELGFPLIRNTQVQGNGFGMLWDNMGPYNVNSTANVDLSSGSTSEINLNGGVGLHLNSPSVYIDQRPPTNESPLILVFDSTNNQIKLRRDVNLPYPNFRVFANQALSMSGDTVQLGRESRLTAQEFSLGRFLTPRDTNSFLEIYDNSTVGRNRFPFKLTSEDFPENGHYGMELQNVTSGVSGHVAMSNNTLRINGEQGVQLTLDFDARFGLQANNNLSYRPLNFTQTNLAGFTVPANQGAIALSDGSRTGTLANQLYFLTENDEEVPLSVKVHSDDLTEFDVPIALGSSNWAWTLPSFYNGYRIVAVEYTFVTAGSNDAIMTIDRDGVPIGLYNATLVAGTRTVRVQPASALVLSTGNVIRGRVLNVSGTAAEGWTLTLELAKT